MNPAILLDTCAAIYILEDHWMRQAAVDAVDNAYDRGEKIFVSPISAWEIGMLMSKGRLCSNHSPQRWMGLLVERPQIAMAQLPAHVLLESSCLPGKIHGDPADRIIAATARQCGFTVITRDRALLDYGKQGHLSVLEC